MKRFNVACGLLLFLIIMTTTAGSHGGGKPNGLGAGFLAVVAVLADGGGRGDRLPGGSGRWTLHTQEHSGGPAATGRVPVAASPSAAGCDRAAVSTNRHGAGQPGSGLLPGA